VKGGRALERRATRYRTCELHLETDIEGHSEKQESLRLTADRSPSWGEKPKHQKVQSTQEHLSSPQKEKLAMKIPHIVAEESSKGWNS